MEITGIDHFVLTVNDIEQTCSFYSDLLDIDIIRYGDDRTALQVGSQKINLHEVNSDISLRARYPRTGVDDFCLLTDTPIHEVVTEIKASSVEIIEGPTERDGARGPMKSIYFRDPDGNLVEIASYETEPRDQH